MNRVSLHSPALRSLRALFWSIGLVLFAFVASPDQSYAQVNCDSLSVTARGGDSCCFNFLFEKSLSNYTISKVTMTSVGANVTSASGPSNVQVTRSNNTVTYAYANGLPARTDGPSACFSITNGTNRFNVVFVWYNANNQAVCADTLALECGGGTAGCAAIAEGEIACNPNGGWTWNFNVRNQSNFYGRNYRLTPQTQGISISPDSGSANGTVAPNGLFPRHHATITGGQPGQTVRFTLQMCGSSTADGRDVRCCTTTVEVRLPECAPANNCFDIVEQSIQCKPEAGANAYSWCIRIRNNTGHLVNRVQVGNSVVNLGNLQPGGTETACLTIYGQPGGTAVTVILCGTVRDTMIGANGTVRDTLVATCCERRVELKLPECTPKNGCFELVNAEIGCDSSGWRWCFNIRNQSSMTFSYFTTNWTANSIYQLSGPLAPGALSERICLTIPRIPNQIEPGMSISAIISMFNNDRKGCTDTVRIDSLPRCGEPNPDNCCDGFIIRMTQTRPVASPNGVTGLLGLVLAGPSPIKKVVASLASVSVNSQPAYGYAMSGTLFNAMGSGTVTPGPYGQEIVWTSPTGVPMMSPTNSLAWLRFPPMAPNASRDTLRFCIRWQFTDVNCRTCDTLVCYSVVRRRLLSFNNVGNTSKTEAGKGAAVQGGGDGFIGGKLMGNNSGQMTLTLPTLPDGEFGTVRFTGVTLQADEGVILSNVVDADGKYTFMTQLGVATAAVDAAPGETINMNLSYQNLGNRTSLGHFLILSYETDMFPGETIDVPVTVTLRSEDATGGDVVTAVSAEVPNATVQTFALHLKNLNKTGENLSGLMISGQNGLEFLAVGPTSHTNEAILRFGMNGDEGHAYISEAAEGTVMLSPSETRGPIYLTVAIHDNEIEPSISFATLNQFDEIVTQGIVNLLDISSVGRDGDIGSESGTSHLGHVVPNPTRESATLTFRLDREQRAVVVVRDIRGREVARLIDGEILNAGLHVLSFDVRDLSSGQYYYTLETESILETRPMTVTH